MSKGKGIKQPRNGSRQEQFAYHFADSCELRGYRKHSSIAQLVDLLMDGKWHQLDELERAFPNVGVRGRLYTIQRHGPYALDVHGHPKPWRLDWSNDRRSVRLVSSSGVNVKVEIINIPVSVADWKFAQQASEQKLPPLTEEQKSIAKGFGISPKEYARSVLARRYAEVRYRTYSEQFRHLLAKAASNYPIRSAEVIYDLWEGMFYCQLRRDDSLASFRVAADLITVPVDRGDLGSLRQAEEAIRVGLRQVNWLSPQEVQASR